MDDVKRRDADWRTVSDAGGADSAPRPTPPRVARPFAGNLSRLLDLVIALAVSRGRAIFLVPRLALAGSTVVIISPLAHPASGELRGILIPRSRLLRVGQRAPLDASGASSPFFRRSIAVERISGGVVRHVPYLEWYPPVAGTRRSFIGTARLFHVDAQRCCQAAAAQSDVARAFVSRRRHGRRRVERHVKLRRA